MLSVVIATDGEERAVAATLSALVSGAAAGVVRDVVLVAREPSDLLERIADATGCALLPATGTRGAGLAAGAREARSDWLMFLTPGAIPDHGWIDELAEFVEGGATRDNGEPVAAVFSRIQRFSLNPARLIDAIGRAFVPGPEQGLVISRRHYQEVGGHAAEARDPERRLVSRIGRARRVTLRTRVHST